MKLNSALGNGPQAASHRWVGVALTLALAAAFIPLAHPAPARQIPAQQAAGEIAATLSSGHVVWCVTRDAILVAALAGGDEQGSHLPAILPISSFRMGILLGAVDWSQG